jgi:hypothetical protein
MCVIRYKCRGYSESRMIMTDVGICMQNYGEGLLNVFLITANMGNIFYIT